MPDAPRTILGITGSRSEYYLQRPIFQAMMAHLSLSLSVIVTGAHLSPLHGNSEAQVLDDNIPITARIENLLWANTDSSRLKSAANQLQALAQVVDSARPDLLFVAGDREEALTMAICGSYLNIPVVHYAAGDIVVGNVDDTVRHAVSRLSHVLMTTHDEATDRLVRAGEEPWRVHTVGHAGIDRLRTTPEISDGELAKGLGADAIRKPYVVVIHNPLSSTIDKAGDEMEEVLAAVKASGLEAFIGYPNSDPGSHSIVEVIERYARAEGSHTYRNLPDKIFVNLLRGASALVGNSSLGLLEAPFLKLPAINVGKRQGGRFHTSNVRFVQADRVEIQNTLRMVLNDPETIADVSRCGSPFGDGHTGERVASLLSELPLGSRLLDKEFTY